MNTSKFISDKIDQDTNIIWFENSNNYVIVNDVINNLILNKLAPSKYPLKFESIKLIEKPNNQSVREEINTLVSDCNKNSNRKEIKEVDLTNFISKDYSKISYNNRVVKIEYENKNLKELIDPKFFHLNSNENDKFLKGFYFREDERIETLEDLFKEDLKYESIKINQLQN